MKALAWILGGLTMAALPAVSQVTQITEGPGDDTEAAWSPDGTKVAFQSDRAGSMDIYVLDLASGQVTPVVQGPGESQFPAWSPDGSHLAFVHVHLTKTAVQGIELGHCVHIVPASGGEPRRLTGGVDRDHTPTWSQDGQSILFSTTRGMKDFAVCLQRVPVAGGEPETLDAQDAMDNAMMQPDISPDGRHIAYGFVNGFRSNWCIRLAKADRPTRRFQLTSQDMSMYGPRWSPDGSVIACTGYRPGDPGWGIYLLQVATGAFARLDTGEGNSRSATWSPDGAEIIFENNRTGQYKLYRMPVPQVEFTRPAELEVDERVELVRFDFASRPAERVQDLSGQNNHGKLVANIPWENGALILGQGGYLQIENPTGFDFGSGAFSVSADVEPETPKGELQILAVGDYPESRHGWQIMVSTDNRWYFNSRGVGGEWSAAMSNMPVEGGRRIKLTGIRYRDGRVEMYIDGVRQSSVGARAKYKYAKPTQVRIGTLFDGSAPFHGKLYAFSACQGVADIGEQQAASLHEFLAN